jgi:hypothetical protein
MKAGGQTSCYRRACGPEPLTPIGGKHADPLSMRCLRIRSLGATVACSWPVGSWRQEGCTLTQTSPRHS